MKKNHKIPKLCALALILTSLSLYITACGTTKPSQDPGNSTSTDNTEIIGGVVDDIISDVDNVVQDAETDLGNQTQRNMMR